MCKKGFLVTFEGGEGSGKTTQSGLFCQFLNQEKINYIFGREPGGTPFSEYVRMLIKDETFRNKSSLSELLLFESARADIVDKIIEPALNDGAVMVLDRFYDSTLAYQGYGRGIDKDMIKNLNKIASKGIAPDLTFYLKISAEEAFKRKAGEKFDVIEQSGIDFHNRVSQGFDETAKENNKRVVVADATQDTATIQKRVREVFLERYYGKIKDANNKKRTTTEFTAN